MSASIEELVGQVVLGEHQLKRLVRSDGALALFEAVSTVDQGVYTVIVAPHVRVETASTAIESAIDRAGRHALGVKGLVSLLKGATVVREGGSLLAAVRRGPPGDDPMPGRVSISDAVRLLSPLADALSALHEQGLTFGALCPLTVGRRDGALALDFYGLGAAAEAASGARGARDLLAQAYRPPELRGERPSSPGPWTDIAGLAILALEMITGSKALLEDRCEPPDLESHGLVVSPQVTDLFARALASSPRLRPLDARAFLRELQAGAAAPVGPRPSAPQPSAPQPAPSAPQPAPSAPQAAPQALPSAPQPRPSAPQPLPLPDTDAMQEARQRRLLAVLVGTGLLLLVGGMGAASVFSLKNPRRLWPGPLAAASASAPAASASASPAEPAFSVPASPAGDAVYEADTRALIPVNSDDPVWGERDAYATVVIFGDPTCPFTAKLMASVPSLIGRFNHDLRLVYKLYPRPGNPDAQRAAEAAAVAWELGKSAAFWSFVGGAGRLSAFDREQLDALGVKAGLGAGSIIDGLTRRSQVAHVERDVELGRRLGARGTPVVFINGRRLDGLQAYATLVKEIDDELGRSRDRLSKGTPREQLYARRTLANVTTSEGETRR